MSADEKSAGLGPSAGETLDALFGGRVKLLQRERGYRFSIDPLLLAAFAGLPKGGVVDLGCGCGIVAILMALRGAVRVYGVELQRSLFELAQRNVKLNGCEEQVRALHCDLRQVREQLGPSRFDLVLSNPPFIPAGEGRLPPESERAQARHELTATLEDLLEAARYLLRVGGSFRAILPGARLSELLCAAERARLSPRAILPVYTRPKGAAPLVLVDCVKGGKERFSILPPLALHAPGGGYSAEAERILAEPLALLGATD